MTTAQQPPAITSTGNKRVVEARKLSQRKYRQAGARFLVEGLQLLHMALDAGATPHEVFFCPEQFAGPEAEALIARFRQAGGELLPVAPNVMAALSERDEPQGIVATFHIPEASLADLKLTGRELVLVLDRLQDPGNLGTLIRTADAVGAAAIILIEPCVDPFDPKTLRGSMGSLFNVPVDQHQRCCRSVCVAARPRPAARRRRSSHGRAVGRRAVAGRGGARPRQRGAGIVAGRGRTGQAECPAAHRRQGGVAERGDRRRGVDVCVAAGEPGYDE